MPRVIGVTDAGECEQLDLVPYPKVQGDTVTAATDPATGMITYNVGGVDIETLPGVCGGKKLVGSGGVTLEVEPDKYTVKAVEPPTDVAINGEYPANGQPTWNPEGPAYRYTSAQLEALGKRECDNYVELRLDVSTGTTADYSGASKAGWLINGDNVHKFKVTSNARAGNTEQMLGFYPLDAAGGLTLQRTLSNAMPSNTAWKHQIRAFAYRD